MEWVPRVSLRDYCSDDLQLRKQFIQSVGKAFETVGFVRVECLEDLSAAYERVHEVAEAAFRMPEDVKSKYARPDTGGLGGYFRLMNEEFRLPAYNQLREDGKAEAQENSIFVEAVEMWSVSRDPAVNSWPSEIPNFQNAMSHLYRVLDVITFDIVRACGSYLANSEALLAALVEGGLNTLRISRYPDREGHASDSPTFGPAHEDVSLLTVFREGTSDGLQIQLPTGEWIGVMTQSNELLIGVGDILTSLTNGIFRSGTHRVLPPVSANVRRVSVPFFICTRKEVPVGPMRCLVNASQVPKFPDMSTAQMLNERLGMKI